MTTSAHPTDLEPALVDFRTYSTRRRGSRLDSALIINVMILMLTMIPAWLIVPGTTDVGRPALVLCVAMFFWWVVARFSPWLTLVGPQPLRWVVLIYGLSMVMSYSAGFLRGLTEMEINSADRWMISTAAFAGVILTAADGIPNWDRLRSVLKVFVGCAAAMALLGLLQYIFAVDVVQYIALPGLEVSGWVPDVENVGRGLRVASTTAHYIELSAVLALALPFGIHLARFAPSTRARILFLVATLAIAAGIPVTISRTGMAAAVIAVLTLVPQWGWRVRYNMLVLGLGLAAALAIARPTLVGSLIDLFMNAGEDPSITSRTERYAMVGYYFAERPMLGRGTGTWVSPQYQYLDNQWLATALCNGAIGVAALAALHITAGTLALIALRRATEPQDRHLCAALVATQLIAIFVAATFDSLWFSTFATALALMIGLCGTVWRFTHPLRQVRTSTAQSLPGKKYHPWA